MALQTVFRIKPRAKRIPKPADKHIYHARKPHTKSRGGCRACKERRIKCDEARPECQNCISRSIACYYNVTKVSLDIEERWAHDVNLVPLPDTFGHHLVLRHLESRIENVIGGKRLCLNIASRSRLLCDLHRFNECTVYDIGMKSNQQLMVDNVKNGIWSQPALMYLTFAVSNAHAKRVLKLQPAQDAAETIHWQLALEEYTTVVRRLSSASILDNACADELVAATYLLMASAFSIGDEIVETTFLDGDQKQIRAAISPISAAGGMHSLMRIYPNLCQQSSWRVILLAIANAGRPIELDRIPPEFIELCKLEEQDQLVDDNIYNQMLCHMVPLIDEVPCTRQLCSLFGMIGNVWPKLQELLVRRDCVALLLFAWWLALLEGLDIWWASTRARTTRRSIMIYLSMIDDPDHQPCLRYLTATYSCLDWTDNIE